MLLLAIGLGSCSGEERPNLLIVSVDTLRADHCSAYGYRRATTPRLRQLAGEGALFTQAYAPMPTTAPSHATLFTGLYPLSHGLIRNGLALRPETVTLAEVLRDEGYETAAFVSSFVLDPRFGFAEGFEHYDARFASDGATIRKTHWEGRAVDGGFDRRARVTSRLAREWLSQRDRDRPFFLFVHFFDPHHPYAAPPRFRNRFRRAWGSSLIAMYDAEIAAADHALGTLLEGLSALGLSGSTLVVFTADHGEGLRNHGVPAHGAVIYEEAVKIPMVLRFPGRIDPGLRAKGLVHLGDVMLTVLDLLSVDPAGLSSDGISLAPVLSEGAVLEARPVFFQRRRFLATRIGDRSIHGREFGVRLGRWKLIENVTTAEVELYDLARDAREQRNVAASEPERVRELSARIRDWRAGREVEAGSATELPHDVREQMRALGYVD